MNAIEAQFAEYHEVIEWYQGALARSEQEQADVLVKLSRALSLITDIAEGKAGNPVYAAQQFLKEMEAGS